MARLRRVDCGDSGFRRRRQGRGFVYLDHDGERIDDIETLERIRALAIPPAWEDVWICARPNGRKQHVTVDGDVVAFDYPAKSGLRRRQRVTDERAAEVVQALLRRRAGGDELLAYKEGRRWQDVRSAEINAYLKQASGGDFSAKDFRTWNATVLAAIAIAVSGPVAGDSRAARKRAVRRAVEEAVLDLIAGDESSQAVEVAA